ncbi:hypothetical protein GX50_03815 [[Emmonsia] crescens]|uniref:4-coumarate-CoA ligase n=1 Tax=[Emmonsia] crescens TaxID=73230 RepID=A0A2B7ZJJ5_9EURO|nr:hypothetical protein GX50_03815 [Emmonsia crescens]
MPKYSPFASIPIPTSNLLTFLFPPDSPLRTSTKPIWIDSEDTSINLSTSTALQWVKRLAMGLERFQAASGSSGVKRGEVVLVLSPNQIFVAVAYLGIVGSGRVFSGMNPNYTVQEMVYQMKNTEAKAILVHPSLVNIAIAAAKEANISLDRLFQFSETANPTNNGVRDWSNGLLTTVQESHSYHWPELDGDEAANTVATINYSSGTTGLPKGVCVSHRNVMANVLQSMAIRGVLQRYSADNGPPQRWIGFLPLYHVYGQMYTIIVAAKMQVPVYVMKKFVYEDFLRVIQDHKITNLHVAPPIMVMLSKRPETAKYDLSSVKAITCGAAPLSRKLQNEVSQKLGVVVQQGWGMTEVTSAAMHVPGGLSDDTGSVGVLDPNCECKLLDDDGKEVADGEPGEIYIRSPNVTMGYWKNEEATRETMLPDGWLRTGDVAVARGDWFWIVDRKKELIKVNALQVAPAELEAALLEHDDIADAAVVGMTIEDEEFPRAYVVIKDSAKQANSPLTPAEIQEWIKPRVSKHKWLTGGVVVVDEVPKSPSGKILRKVMREWAKRDAAKLQSSRARL